MAQQYASKQPAGFKNKIENVAIVGFSGTVGKFITASLVEAGKHKVTAITREGGSSKAPDGVDVKKVNYDDPSTIVKALQGQDALIITMGVTAPPEQQIKLIDAAAEANVPWVFPNEFGYALSDTGAGKESLIGMTSTPNRRHVAEVGKSSWIGLTCGFWYEFSLSAGAFGFDFQKRTATFIDDGTYKINTSTLPQVGRAVASLLSLKVLPEDENDKVPTVSKYRDDFIYFTSFKVSQKDIFESILRVTGTKTEDWNITNEPHKEYYEEGMKKLMGGDQKAFSQVLYTRMLYPDGTADLEPRGLSNDVLGLPKEDLDEWTRKSAEAPKWEYDT